MYTPTFSPYSEYGYAALKRQSASLPVIPNTYFQIISDKVVPSYNITTINQIAGDRARMRGSVQGTIEVGGPIEFYVEERVIGHVLTGIFGAPRSQQIVAGLLYRHGWDVTNTPSLYTFDVAVAGSPGVHRFFNTYITKFSLSQQDNAIKCSMELMPTKAFIDASVTVEVSSGTTLSIDGSDGLVVNDHVLVIDKNDNTTVLADLTVTGITDSRHIEVSTIGVTIEVDDYIVIKRAAQSAVVYNQCQPFQFSNGTQVFTGDDIDNTSERVTEDFGIELTSEAERHWGSGNSESDRYPYVVVVKGYAATGKLSKIYDSDEYLNLSRKNARLAVRYLFNGSHYVTTNSATKARSNFGSTNGFYVEAATAGKAGNDINVTMVVNTIDTLQVVNSGDGLNNIIIKLANTTTASNTGTAIAALIDALAITASVANGDGSQTFSAADVFSNTNLGYALTGTNVVGTDANSNPYLEFDFPSGNIKPFFVNNSENAVVMQDINLDFYSDLNCQNQQQKLYNSRVFLLNSVTTYV